jgi:FAD/FMN-containing dehydrogenase
MKELEVNDLQSRLNATRVARIEAPTSEERVSELVRAAGRTGQSVCVAGGRHSMGGQQFAEGALLLDMRELKRVIALDRATGLIEVEAGIQWPDLIRYLHSEQSSDEAPWAIRQKQTGVDDVTIGGSLGANGHGRGLTLPPLVNDVESFVLVDAHGDALRCSRTENAELFSLAIGGYGLFGVMTRVTLRLEPRKKVRRVVSIIPVRELMERIGERLERGYLYGDCQYSVDLSVEAGSHPGVFSCYAEVDIDTPLPQSTLQLTSEDWGRLYQLVRTDKARAFQAYSMYYLRSSGQVYWSDKHQLSTVFEGYTGAVDVNKGTEMISELYVPREDLVPFMAAARADLVQREVDVTYGTIRLIERDEDTFLPWATEPWVCIVINLHVTHSEEGKRRAAENFQRLIDRAIEFGGSYFLTYHRWATRAQVEACYPQFPEMLRKKRTHDPDERFQSTWYRHYRDMFADQL